MLECYKNQQTPSATRSLATYTPRVCTAIELQNLTSFLRRFHGFHRSAWPLPRPPPRNFPPSNHRSHPLSSGNARPSTRLAPRIGRFRCRMKINAAQFVCIINLRGAPGRGGRHIGHRRYFKHSWLLCKIDRKFQLFPDKPVRGDPGAISVPRTICALTQLRDVDCARRCAAVNVSSVADRCHFSITGQVNAV